MAVLTILAISACGFFLGSAVFFGVTSGPLAVLASPLLALFGWFYLFPLVLCVSILWSMYGPWLHRPPLRVLFVAVGAIVGCLIMLAIGVRGPEPEWPLAYALAGATTGAFAAGCVAAMKCSKPKTG